MWHYWLNICHGYRSYWYSTIKVSTYYTIIDFWWGLLMTMKTALTSASVNQYLTRSSWSWVDQNQKSIIALILNYREFSFTKIEISIVTAFYRARQVKSSAQLKMETPNRPLNAVSGLLTLRYARVNAVSANQRRANYREIPHHLIK